MENVNVCLSKSMSTIESLVNLFHELDTADELEFIELIEARAAQRKAKQAALEPMTNPANNRLTFEPIEYPILYDAYVKAVGAYWHASEIDLSKDLDDWKSLTDNERTFIEIVLAFFASADGLVMENLTENMLKEVQIPEAYHYYAFQNAVESVHSETYSKLLVAYVKDPKRREELFNSVNTMPIIQQKAAWVKKWIEDKSKPFSQRVAAFCLVEGVFFSSSFAAIFWLKKRNKMPGLTHSNELISRDEYSHSAFAALVYQYCRVGKFTQEEIHIMFKEAIDIEERFVRGALPIKLLGMNADDMVTYVKFVADRVLIMLGYETLFKATNPFDFMTMMSIDVKSNFFECKVSSYQKANVGVDANSMRFSLDEDV